MTPSELAAELRALEEAINEADDNCRLHRGDALRRDQRTLLIDNLPTILAALDRAVGPVEDTERLNWIEEQQAAIDLFLPGDRDPYWHVNGGTDDTTKVGPTLRDAIDAAREAQKGAGR